MLSKTHSPERQKVMSQVGQKIGDQCLSKLDMNETLGLLLGLIVSFVVVEFDDPEAQAGILENICNEICRLHSEHMKEKSTS